MTDVDRYSAVRLSSVVPRPSSVVPTDTIRARFPALQRLHRGAPVAYFDGPGGTQVPSSVVEAMADYLFRHNANTHWRYPTSEETDALIADARQALGDFIHGRADEIAFGQNMTTLTFHLGRALGRTWGPGDEIVLTELDHHANIAPWRALERERGVTIRMVRMNPSDGRLDWADLERSIGPRTRLVAIGAASNALGTINDVRQAAEMAHAVGARVFVDAVHYAAHALVDVRQLGCDFLAMSAYKFYGSHIGILWGRRDLVEAIDFPRLDPAPQESPERMETGTQNHEGIVGAGAAVDFLASLATDDDGAIPSRRAALESSFDALHARGDRLLTRLWSGLASIDGVALYGPPPGTPRTPTVGFTVRGVSTDDVAVELAKRAVFVSNGDFYAATVIDRLGLAPGGLVRAGCSCYTTEEEVDRLVDGVRSIA
jgi:cysteine desulfurase family protein (TIGR01976 family)